MHAAAALPVNSMRFQLSAALLLLATGAESAHAQYLGSPFSYNYVEIDYRGTEFDAAGETLDGYYARVSVESTHDIRVLARWGDSSGTVQGQDAKRQDLELGIGFHNRVNRRMDTTFDLKFLRSESEALGVRSTDIGYGIEGGLRGFVNDWFELHGSLEFRDLVETEIGGRAGLLVHFNRHVGLNVGYSHFSEQQSLHAGVRFSL